MRYFLITLACACIFVGAYLYARTPQNMVVNPSCMQAAVATRDNTLVQALKEQTTQSEIALETRKFGLMAIWSGSSQSDTSKKIVMQAYTESMQAGERAFNKAKAEAWKQYTRDAQECGYVDTGSKRIDVYL